MKIKPQLITLGLIVLIGGAFAYVYFAQPQSSQSQQANTSSQAPSQSTSTPQPTTSQPGTYTDFTPNSITSTKGAKVLFFHAPWCPQCRQLDASIKAGPIPDNVAILKVDFDSNQELRKKYGVTIQTTLVRVDDDGNLVKKYVAYDSPTLQAITPNILQ